MLIAMRRASSLESSSRPVDGPAPSHGKICEHLTRAVMRDEAAGLYLERRDCSEKECFPNRPHGQSAALIKRRFCRRRSDSFLNTTNYA
jgi:hypothetical protein